MKQAYYWATSEWSAREIEEAHRTLFLYFWEILSLRGFRRRCKIRPDWTYCRTMRTQVSAENSPAPPQDLMII